MLWDIAVAQFKGNPRTWRRFHLDENNLTQRKLTTLMNETFVYMITRASIWPFCRTKGQKGKLVELIHRICSFEHIPTTVIRTLYFTTSGESRLFSRNRVWSTNRNTSAITVGCRYTEQLLLHKFWTQFFTIPNRYQYLDFFAKILVIIFFGKIRVTRPLWRSKDAIFWEK